MTSRQFKKWLTKQGCTFERGHGGHLIVRLVPVQVGPTDARQEGHADRNNGSDQERSRVEVTTLGWQLNSPPVRWALSFRATVLEVPETSNQPLHLTSGEGDVGECCTTR